MTLLFTVLILAIKNADRCYYLFLEADSLESLPSNFISLKHLKGIAFKHCPMVNWDEVVKQLAQLPTLEYLEISVSNLKSLPENIGALQQLHSLNLKSNLFTELPLLNYSMQQASVLNLSFNRKLNWSITGGNFE